MNGFDCLMIGGGAVGLACAIRLRAHGLRVGVIERGPPGGEASSAAGGILALVEAARRAGVVVIAAEAQAVVEESGRATGVLLSVHPERSAVRGAESTEVVVNAAQIVVTAGSWSSQLGLPAVAPVRGQ